jgi:lipopolysaccharide export system permease protein
MSSARPILDLRVTILDRFVIGAFVRTFVVCFLSLVGLYVIIDAFSNFDDFLAEGQKNGLMAVLGQYYGPRMLSFFDATSPLLTLCAACFTITGMQRANEFTAILAAGVSKTRVVRWLIVAALSIFGLSIANREYLLPMHRDALTRRAQDWGGEKVGKLAPIYDLSSGVLINGRGVVLARKQIRDPMFQLPAECQAVGRFVVAEEAYYSPPKDDRPGGYTFNKVRSPANLSKISSASVNGKTIFYSPKDTPWLKPNSCFIATDVRFDDVAGGAAWRQFSSTATLLSDLWNPAIDFGSGIRVLIHSRIMRPLLDASLLFLGLPIVLARHQRHFLVIGGICLLIVGGFSILVMACQSLGTSTAISAPVAAWLPILISAPIATIMCQFVWE